MEKALVIAIIVFFAGWLLLCWSAVMAIANKRRVYETADERTKKQLDEISVKKIVIKLVITPLVLFLLIILYSQLMK